MQPSATARRSTICRFREIRYIGRQCRFPELAIPVRGILLDALSAAIPAYQDYTIRDQVAEGLNLAASVKASVEDAYAASENWPVDLAATGLNAAELSGQYVTSIAVGNGVVLIRYGNRAHSSIAGRTLALHPASVAGDNARWVYGYAVDEDVSAPPTDVPPKYLPALCRPKAP